jgi:hypothetical protein
MGEMSDKIIEILT